MTLLHKCYPDVDKLLAKLTSAVFFNHQSVVWYRHTYVQERLKNNNLPPWLYLPVGGTHASLQVKRGLRAHSVIMQPT